MSDLSPTAISSVSLRDLKLLLRARYRLARLTDDERCNACDIGRAGCSSCLNQLCQQVRTILIARRGGLRRYLFDMLGREGHRDVSDCRFVSYNGYDDPQPAGMAGHTIVEFLTGNFTIETLPWGVLVPNGQGEPRLLVF